MPTAAICLGSNLFPTTPSYGANWTASVYHSEGNLLPLAGQKLPYGEVDCSRETAQRSARSSPILEIGSAPLRMVQRRGRRVSGRLNDNNCRPHSERGFPVPSFSGVPGARIEPKDLTRSRLIGSGKVWSAEDHQQKARRSI